LHANLKAVFDVSRAMHGTEPTKHYTFLYVKDMNINYEVHIYLCITEPYQKLRELSIVDFDKELVRQDSFKPKIMMKILHPAS
jgi:hypothetical protein